MKNYKKNASLLIVSALIVGSIVYLEKHKERPLDIDAKDVVVNTQDRDLSKGQDSIKSNLASKSKKYQKAKELVDATGYINTEAFKLSDIVGKKVVLIDFWTYSCINCQRTFPYLKAWNEKYKDQGLVIIGVHTPEFDFEKNYNNVLSATKKFGITYPVVLDSNRGTWTAYSNQYWPREYLIDIDGYVVHDHIGEGGYSETEKAIQEALKERVDVLGLKDNIDTTIVSPNDVISMNGSQVGSPETYFGGLRNEYLGNGKKYAPGSQILVIPENTNRNTLYLGGTWNFSSEYARSESSSSNITYKYKAKNVYFVASSKNGVPVKILLDGKPIDKQVSGEDVASDSTVLIKENRLYDIVHGADYGEHTLEIQIEGSGVDAYTFTFG